MSLDELGQEIIEPNLDLAIDYSEIGLDEFFDNGLLKEIPIVRSLAAIVRTGIAIRERFFIKKFVVFLRELHQGSVDKKEWEE
ncbi:MAG: hypothetical protein KGH97_03555, partial [Patescibacteria group bacterium]|nr:hypothetical protein [Patescibacteria group bacterium]